jgi:hypothetical protein
LERGGVEREAIALRAEIADVVDAGTGVVAGRGRRRLIGRSGARREQSRANGGGEGWCGDSTEPLATREG